MSYQIANNCIGVNIQPGLDSFNSRNLNKTISQQYFPCHSHQPRLHTFQNCLPPESRPLTHYDSSFFNPKVQSTFYDSGQLQKQNLEKNRSFNTSVISQHLSRITEAFEKLQQQELNEETVRKFNKMRRLLEIVHKFVVEEKLYDAYRQPDSQHDLYNESQLSKKYSQSRLAKTAFNSFNRHQNQVETSPNSELNTKFDTGTQCSLNQDDLTDKKVQQDSNTTLPSHIDKNQVQQMVDKLIGLSVKSLNLSIHALNMKSFESHQMRQTHQLGDKKVADSFVCANNQSHCCKNHLPLQQLAKMNPNGKSSMKKSQLSSKVKPPQMNQCPERTWRHQLHSQLTEIKQQMRHFTVKDEEKQNINTANSDKGKSKVKRKLFTVSEGGVQRQGTKESMMSKMKRLQRLYRQTKEIYREYERSMLGSGN